MQYLICERAGLAQYPHAVVEVNGLQAVRDFLALQPGRALIVFMHAPEFEERHVPVSVAEEAAIDQALASMRNSLHKTPAKKKTRRK